MALETIRVGSGSLGQGSLERCRQRSISFYPLFVTDGGLISAITRGKPQEGSKEPSVKTDNASSEPKGQELVYSARVSLDRTQMQIEDKLVNLSPGMAVLRSRQVREKLSATCCRR